jgi:hypothetical protein
VNKEDFFSGQFHKDQILRTSIIALAANIHHKPYQLMSMWNAIPGYQ